LHKADDGISMPAAQQRAASTGIDIPSQRQIDDRPPQTPSSRRTAQFYARFPAPGAGERSILRRCKLTIC
jgi:hypothetical protein